MTEVTIYHNPACGTARNALAMIHNSGVEPAIIEYLKDPDAVRHDAHPILINRPIVVTPRGVRLCRPSEQVLDVLPDTQKAALATEVGEAVVEATGNRVTRPAS